MQPESPYYVIDISNHNNSHIRSKVWDNKNRITFSLKRGCKAVWEISFEFTSLSSLLTVMPELTGLKMNDSNLGHFFININFNDGNLILIPTQNLLRTGRYIRTRCSSQGNNTFGIISSSPKSSVSSTSSITLQSSILRYLSWTINVAVEEDNRYFIEFITSLKTHQWWNENSKKEKRWCKTCVSIQWIKLQCSVLYIVWTEAGKAKQK